MTSESEEIPEIKSCTSQIWPQIRFYLTAFFILVACFSSFSFLFLVPFIIDPGFATIFAEFDSEPVTCVTVQTVSKFGMSNCTWSSCREGCTKDVFQCTQIYVNYLKDTDGIFKDKNITDLDNINDYNWQFKDAKIFPNVQGCGYPPEVNCTIFNKKYSPEGTVFPCYHSKLMPNLTLTYLNLEEVKQSLIYAIVLPWGSFLVSVLYLLLTYVTRTSQENLYPDQPLEVTNQKSNKDPSNYSLKSIGKSINHSVNKLRGGDYDDKGRGVIRCRHRQKKGKRD